ncbi:type II 3-dehydroquinate dehydratase [Lapillicoccus sp.]|uniref:type II 3-dehydroquinate dehydratase n=1 Tax=Lapillicoccus sp. TaxID=1909287 RepID=UPI0025FF9E1E|nr:type II 3-dehydroquinate dehydratase [Lapillicoccus sp.]
MPRPVIAVLNGPNLNLLGEREPAVYGSETLADVERRCRAHADGLGFDVDFRQSNHEGDLVTAAQECRHAVGIVVNAGAYTHTSIALRDALAMAQGPVVEVHLTNVHAREAFRHHSYLSELAAAVIVGCGPQGYEFAISAIATRVAAA